MGNDSDPRAEAANPYASSRSEQAEEKPRRKTKWRIIPTALLAIFSTMQLIGSIAMAAILIGSLVYAHLFLSSNAEAEQVLFNMRLFPRIPQAIIGIACSMVGLMSARYCWQGRWWLSTGLAAMIIAWIVAVNLLAAAFE